MNTMRIEIFASNSIFQYKKAILIETTGSRTEAGNTQYEPGSSLVPEVRMYSKRKQKIPTTMESRGHKSQLKRS